MWNEQKTFLTSQLSSDETLLWSGRPKQGLVFSVGDIYPVFVLAFMALWVTMVASSPAQTFFLVFGIPGLLVALYMNTGRYFINSKQRAKTYYGVTDERIITVSGLFSRQVKSLPLNTLSDISINEKPGGTGTITFGPQEPSKAGLTSIFSRNEQIVYPSFELIQDAKRVYEIIRSAQKNAS